jgi:hypothetical protein
MRTIFAYVAGAREMPGIDELQTKLNLPQISQIGVAVWEVHAVIGRHPYALGFILSSQQVFP